MDILNKSQLNHIKHYNNLGLIKMYVDENLNIGFLILILIFLFTKICIFKIIHQNT